MGRQAQVNVISSTSRTTTDRSSDQSVTGLLNARFLLSVTAVSGTSPTLDITIEGKTRAGNYVTIATFAQVTTANSQSVNVERISQNYRLSWVVGGTTPNFTFEIDAIYDLS